MAHNALSKITFLMQTGGTGCNPSIWKIEDNNQVLSQTEQDSCVCPITNGEPEVL